jgi:hypothetical protein
MYVLAGEKYSARQCIGREPLSYRIDKQQQTIGYVQWRHK